MINEADSMLSNAFYHFDELRSRDALLQILRYFAGYPEELPFIRSEPGTIWNRLRPEEEQTILIVALREPDYSPREIACSISDNAGFAILGVERLPGAEAARTGA